MVDPVTAATTVAIKGVSSTFDYGLAVTILVLIVIGAGYGGYKLVQYLLRRCDARFDKSMESHRELADRVSDVVDKNTIAFTKFHERLDSLARSSER